MKTNTKLRMVRMSLEFAGAVLPVGSDDEGRSVVPLKPIVDVLGLDWKRQLARVNKGYMAKRLGTCMGHMPHAGQSREMVCIRLDRVAAYLNSVNPEKVRAAGNDDGADFLERKQEEWDLLLHEYELANGLLAREVSREAAVRERQIISFLRICREKRSTSDAADRRALSLMAKEVADELGVPYQLELGEEQTG